MLTLKKSNVAIFKYELEDEIGSSLYLGFPTKGNYFLWTLLNFVLTHKKSALWHVIHLVTTTENPQQYHIPVVLTVHYQKLHTKMSLMKLTSRQYQMNEHNNLVKKFTITSDTMQIPCQPLDRPGCFREKQIILLPLFGIVK